MKRQDDRRGSCVHPSRNRPLRPGADPVLIRREVPGDIPVIRAITAAAFAGPGQTPGEEVPEARLVGELRDSPAWLPALSQVATSPAGEVIGHVLCTRGLVGQAPALALGPLTVRPDSQRRGVGTALMHSILGAADALGEPLVALLGDPPTTAGSDSSRAPNARQPRRSRNGSRTSRSAS